VAGNDAIQSVVNITADASMTGVSAAAAITGMGFSRRCRRGLG
jgi:hypothetical protein